MKKGRDKPWADYYDQVNILDELLEEPVEFSLGEQLRRDILSKIEAKGVWSTCSPLKLHILQVRVLPQELPIYLGSDIRLRRR